MIMQAHNPRLERWRQKIRSTRSAGDTRDVSNSNKNNNKTPLKVGVLAQHKKELGVKTENLSSIPGTHMGEMEIL